MTTQVERHVTDSRLLTVRPGEFDEASVPEMAMLCFWAKGYPERPSWHAGGGAHASRTERAGRCCRLDFEFSKIRGGLMTQHRRWTFNG
jgi:hypothetical protein